MAVSELGDAASHTNLAALAADTHLQYALVLVGTLAARPTTPYRTGRIYRATDTAQVFLDNGAGWDELGGSLDALYWTGTI